MADFLSHFLNLVPVTLAQSLLYAYIALGVWLPLRIIGQPDLTCEGSFPLGGCLFAALAALGLHPVLGTVAAIAGGALAGMATAWLYLRLRIHSLLAGILVFTMLWSIDLRLLGKPNVPVPSSVGVFDALDPRILLSNTALGVVLAVLLVLVLGALYAFLSSERGLAMRCVGANAAIAPALRVNVPAQVLAGFGLANAIVAGAGALLVQQQGYADVTMGLGVLINALASLILGEALLGRRTVLRQVLAPAVGSLVFYQLVSVALATGMNPSDLKFATGLFVVLAFALPGVRRRSAESLA
ncbi:MAG TPA: ABC transporter permease [Ramlibacter sp.]|nr:ABC transporter permease [Ramlibacter sp.]